MAPIMFHITKVKRTNPFIIPVQSSADELSNEQVKENKSQEMDKSSTRETFQQQSYDMRQFFDELPLLPSHYCRKNSMKSYLQTDIWSWNQLYLLYTERCNREGKKPLSKFSFLCMKDEKNLAIHIPKKDKCDICCSYELKHVSEEFYKLHQLRKDAARDEKSRDKVAASEGLIHVLCSDLMMVQPLPCLRASSAYYKLKLTAHCFTVHNLLTHDSKAYWFDETQASLNATTFATCLWDYLEEILSESPKTVVLWSDGCSYQNRNSILSNALLHLSMLRNVTIIQKYLVKGHTQMECDSVHSTIERYIQHMDIHLTSQYASHTTSARKLPMPYCATVLNHNFVKDFGVSTIYSSICPGKNKGDPTVTQLRWIQYEPNGKIKYKLNFADDLKDLPIRPRRSAPRESFPQFHPMRPSIPLDKWKDLQSLKNLLPCDTHDFYDNIPHEEESRRALKRKNQNKNDND